MNIVLNTIRQTFHHKTAKNGLIFAVFAFITQGIGFILLLVLANFIAPVGYGYLNLFTIFVQLFSYVVSLSCAGFFGVSYFRHNKNENNSVANAISLISILMSILTIIFVIIFPSFSTIVGVDYRALVIAIVICLCMTYYNLNLDVYRLEEKPLSYGILSLLFCVSNFVFAIYCVVGLSQDWMGRVYSQLFVAILFALIGIFFLSKKGFFTLSMPSKMIFKETLGFGIPLIPHQVAFWIRQSFDRFVINYFLSVSIVGLYGFAFNFANIITIAGSAFNTSFSVYQFKLLSNKTDTTWANFKKMGSIMLVLYLMITIIVIIGCHIIIPLFFEKYVDSLPYVLPLGISALFMCYYMVYVNYLFYYKKTKKLMYITTTCSFAQLVLSFVFTRYGALWTAYISAIVSCLVFLAVFKYSRFLLKENHVISE